MIVYSSTIDNMYLYINIEIYAYKVRLYCVLWLCRTTQRRGIIIYIN